MTKKAIYLIRLNKETWEKYNGTRKKAFRSVLISERFLDDPKVKSLSSVEVLLYLSCILACSQSSQGCTEVGAELISSQSRVRPGLIPSCLDRLQSLQLLTYEKREPLLNRIRKRKEKKGKEKKEAGGSPPAQAPASNLDNDFVLKIPEVLEKPKTPVSHLIAIRQELHLKVHGVKPIEGSQVNGMLSNLVKQIGLEEAEPVLRYFYMVPHPHYKLRGHDLKLLLADKAKLLTEVRKKHPITPDARVGSFNSHLNNIAREEEINRVFAEKNEQT